jgi:hypothetical protein
MTVSAALLTFAKHYTLILCVWALCGLAASDSSWHFAIGMFLSALDGFYLGYTSLAEETVNSWVLVTLSFVLSLMYGNLPMWPPALRVALALFSVQIGGVLTVRWSK